MPDDRAAVGGGLGWIWQETCQQGFHGLAQEETPGLPLAKSDIVQGTLVTQKTLWIEDEEVWCGLGAEEVGDLVLGVVEHQR